jgi:hypothetical protein
MQNVLRAGSDIGRSGLHLRKSPVYRLISYSTSVSLLGEKEEEKLEPGT